MDALCLVQVRDPLWTTVNLLIFYKEKMVPVLLALSPLLPDVSSMSSYTK